MSNEQLTQEIASLITAKRKALGIQQLNVAMAIGISQSLYCKLETGAREPKITMLYALADVFACPVYELLPMDNVNADECLPFDVIDGGDGE